MGIARAVANRDGFATVIARTRTDFAPSWPHPSGDDGHDHADERPGPVGHGKQAAGSCPGLPGQGGELAPRVGSDDDADDEDRAPDSGDDGRLAPAPRGDEVDEAQHRRDLDGSADRERPGPPAQPEHDQDGDEQVDIPEPELHGDGQPGHQRQRPDQVPVAEPKKAGQEQGGPGGHVHRIRHHGRERCEHLGEGRWVQVRVWRDQGRGRIVEGHARGQSLRAQPVRELVGRHGPAHPGHHEQERRTCGGEQQEGQQGGTPARKREHPPRPGHWPGPVRRGTRRWISGARNRSQATRRARPGRVRIREPLLSAHRMGTIAIR